MHIYAEALKLIYGKPTVADVTVALINIQTMRPEQLLPQDPAVRLLVQKLTQLVNVSDMTQDEYNQLSEWLLDQVPVDPREQHPGLTFISVAEDGYFIDELQNASNAAENADSPFLLTVNQGYQLLSALAGGVFQIDSFHEAMPEVFQLIIERQDEVAMRALLTDPQTLVLGRWVFVEV